uniref:phosphatase domain-containing protein n=1 Tax=Acidocella sp. TaxID=50710 RepID=UPI002608909B
AAAAMAQSAAPAAIAQSAAPAAMAPAAPAHVITPVPSPSPAANERVAVTRYPGASSGPRGFIWIEEGRLSATPMPGITTDVDYDLELLKGVGVTTLITLTEKDFPQDVLARHGLKNVHLPIADRKAPTPAEMDMLVVRMRELLDAGKVLAVHCLAGLGRTGTILAAYLVKEKGLSAQVALNQIRRFNRQFVQSDDQEDFLVEYEVQQEQNVLRNRASDVAKS